MSYAAPRTFMPPRPLWVIAIVLGFVYWWPVGLAILLGRMFMKRSAAGGSGWSQSMGRFGCWQMPDMMNRAARGFSYAAPSGNRAFDEYRSETLRRLEDEQKEFVEYLDRLRQARDRQEFEQFMADRRGRPATTDDAPRA